MVEFKRSESALRKYISDTVDRFEEEHGRFPYKDEAHTAVVGRLWATAAQSSISRDLTYLEKHFDKAIDELMSEFYK